MNISVAVCSSLYRCLASDMILVHNGKANRNMFFLVPMFASSENVKFGVSKGVDRS